MLSFLSLAESRYSVRKFDERQISRSQLDSILRAGQIAPTAVNKQPQKIVVIQSEEGLAKVRAVTKYAFNAPTVLMVCADQDEAWVAVDGESSGKVDAAIVITHMMLQAWDEGIGSCWVRGYDKNELIKAFNIPPNLDPVALLPIGYPAEGTKPAKGWHDARKPLEETVIYI